MKTVDFFAAIMLVSPAALGQWSVDPTTNTAVCTAIHDQKEVAITNDGAGGVIVAWRDYRNDPTMFGGDIFAQRLNGRGEPLWGTDGIIVNGPGTGQFRPEIVTDGAGGAIIVWEKNHGGFYDYDLFAQRIDGAGARQWGTSGTTIASGTETDMFHKVIADGEGGAIVVWQRLPVIGAATDIYTQKINSDGVTQWTSNGVPVSTAAEHQTYPGLVSDGQGGAIICWTDARNGMLTDIYVQRMSGAGSPVWDLNGIPACTNPSNQTSAVLCTDGSGGAIVAWEDTRGTGTSVFAQRFSATGQAEWTADGREVSPEPGDARSPVICEDGANGALLAWIEEVTVTGPDVVSQRVDEDGMLLWNPDGVDLCLAAQSQLNLSVVRNEAGGFVVAWLDLRSGLSDIYGQWVNGDGVVQWNPNGVMMSNAPGEQIYPVVATDGLGGTIVAWDDRRNGNDDVYAQNVDYAGELGSGRNIYRRSALARVLTDGQPVSDTVTVPTAEWTTQPTLFDVSINIGRVTHPAVQDLSFTMTHETLFDTLIYRVDGGGGENFVGTLLNDALGEPFDGASAPFTGVFQPYRPLGMFTGVEPAGTWILTVTDHNPGSDGLLEEWSLLLSFSGITDVRSDPAGTPTGFTLYQNYPNPFNPKTEIGFQITEYGLVSLRVYDLLGREVATLVNESRAPGMHEVAWDATGMPSGVYFYRLKAGDHAATRKLVLLR